MESERWETGVMHRAIDVYGVENQLWQSAGTTWWRNALALALCWISWI